MADKLETYRAKRDATRTSEPIPAQEPLSRGEDDTFVIQEHHARSLHWDLRLERGGVLVSWAIPKGLPPDPATNHLAVLHTEDHPVTPPSPEEDGFSHSPAEVAGVGDGQALTDALLGTRRRYQGSDSPAG
ncbi:DNA polymerase ligase N-terminal domain-containing protein [Microbispora siamensis]